MFLWYDGRISMLSILLSARELLALSWKHYTGHIARFLEISLWMLIPSLFQLGFLFLFTSPLVSLSLRTAWTINTVVSRILGIVLFTWVHIRLIKLALAHNPKEEGYIVTHPHIGWELFFPVLWVSLLFALAFLGGSLFLVLPGLWLFFALIFSNIIVVDTGKRGLQALQASFSLVSGRFWPIVWRTFAVVVSFFGIIFLLRLCLLLLLGVLFSGSMSQDMARLSRDLLFNHRLSIDTMRAFGLTHLKDTLLLSISLPFLVIAQTTLYKSLKMR